MMKDDLFGSIGLGFPTNKTQLENFDRLHSDYNFQINEEAIDPLKILREKDRKPTNIDYHKRIVLAAEIVYQLHNEYTLGHVKLQKIIYLCNQVNKMNLHVSFFKQAMGPYDNSLKHSIDKKFLENNWFLYTPDDFPLYKPLENAGQHKEWYENYFAHIATEIDFIINLFRKEKTDIVELVVTIYACWLEALEKRELITDKLIIYKVNNWSKQKRGKFSDQQIIEKREWMNDIGLVPSLS